MLKALLSSSKYRRQSGLSLVVALVFVAVLALLGVSVVMVTMNEEKMGRNFSDQDRAFQSAEAALRDAEIRILGRYHGPNPAPIDQATAFTNMECQRGLCNINSHVSHFQLLQSGGGFELGHDLPADTVLSTDSGPFNTGSPQMRDVRAQPRYVIQPAEWQPPGSLPKVGYRISAIGFGRNSEVLLEEFFQPHD